MLNVKAKPTPYSTMIWLSKVKIDISSGHQLIFETPEEQKEYFTSSERSVLLVDDGEYIKNKSGELSLEIKKKEVDGKYNYLVFVNPEHENRFYYCNIVDYQYSTDGVTRISYAIDNLQTYWFDLDLNEKSNIVRRHFHKSEYDDIMKLPYEDLDRGMNNIITMETMHRISSDESYFVITLSNPIKKDFSENYTSLFNFQKEQTYTTENNQVEKYIHNATVTESTIVFIVNDVALKDLITNVFNTPDHVNKLLKISYIPFNVSEMGTTEKNVYNQATGRPIKNKDGETCKLYIPTPSVFTTSKKYDVFGNAKNIIKAGVKGDFRTFEEQDFKRIFRQNLSAIEKYMLRKPFTNVLVYDVDGNANEYGYDEVTWAGDKLGNDDLTLHIYGVLGIIPTISYKVNKPNKYEYNKVLKDQYVRDFEGKPLIVSDLDISYITPSENISIVNDYTSAFLQSNQNAINQQKTNASLSFDMSVNNANASAQRGLAGAQLGYNNQMLQRETDMSNFAVRQQLDQNNHQLGMIGNTFNIGANAIGNLASGNIGGALGGLIGGGVSMGINNMQFSNTQEANSQIFNSSMATSLEIANNSLSHQQAMINSMKGQAIRNASMQHKMTIDTMNAKMLDVKNRPDNVSSMTGGTLMNVLFNRYNIYMRTFTPDPRQIFRLSNYLAEFGFFANTYETINEIKEKFEDGFYIQTANANISGSIPQSALYDIKQQFDNGIFLWKKEEYYRKIEVMKGV